MTSTLKLLSLAFAAALVAPLHGQSVVTDPVGFVTVTIAAGTGSAKVVTPLAVPLLASSNVSGQVTGVITNVTADTISNTSAGWTDGQLSTAATPQLIKIKTGNAAGRTLLISTSTANTATTVTIDPADASGVELDLRTLGINLGVDTYQILACDTLASFFGTPDTTGILGGTSAATSDSIVLVLNGIASTYYWKTDALGGARWTKSNVQSPDATNTPIRPDIGVSFNRLGSSAIVLTILGVVPTTNRVVPIKNSGITYLAQGWPSDVTLGGIGGLNLQNSPNWTPNVDANSADTVVIKINGAFATYYYDPSSNPTPMWRKQNIQKTPSDDLVIPSGSMMSINQRGTNAGFSFLNQTIPYTL